MRKVSSQILDERECGSWWGLCGVGGLTWIAIFRGNSTVTKCGWGPSELKGKGKVTRGGGRREGMYVCVGGEGGAEWDTHCQNVSGS